jgi:hypothetical protein
METMLPQKNKLGQESEGNEEKGYPVTDSNESNIDYTKKPNKASKNTLKEESCKKSLRISWRCY